MGLVDKKQACDWQDIGTPPQRHLFEYGHFCVHTINTVTAEMRNSISKQESKKQWWTAISTHFIQFTCSLALFYSLFFFSYVTTQKKAKFIWIPTARPLKGHISPAASRWGFGIAWQAIVQTAARLGFTDCVYWPGNSPWCCCFCVGFTNELCWFDVLPWTTSMSLLIDRRLNRPFISRTSLQRQWVHFHGTKLFRHTSINVDLFV